MLMTCPQCMVVGKNSFKTKAGADRYSLTFANGSGEPLKVDCTVEQWANVIPMSKAYTCEINADTSGYDVYCNLVSITEFKQK